MVPIGAVAVVPFAWEWNCYTYGGAPISVTDTEGWVESWTPTYAFSSVTCGPCFLPRYPGNIDVAVPSGVPGGTTSTVTISGLNSSETIILEAEDTVPASATTWGRIKALYD